MAILANELRIGNWVSQKYAEYDLANNSKGYYFSNNQIRFEDLKWCEDYPDNYKPIPLTPEILEKCGFKLTDDGISPYWKLEISSTEVLSIEDDWSIGLNAANEGSDQGYATHLNTLKYLHQLQNLYFALTGAELEVKL